MKATDVQTGFENPGYQYEHARDPVVARYVSELEALGFEPLGVRWEAPPGKERVRSLALASAQLECFASTGVFNHKATAYLLTTFTDGAVVITWFGSVHDEVRTERFVHQNAAGSTMAELLAAHRPEVVKQVSSGRTPVADWTAAGRLAAAGAYYANPHNQLTLSQLRFQGQVVGLVFDLLLLAVWILALVAPMQRGVSLGLVISASIAMAVSHWRSARAQPGSRALGGLRWLSVAIAAASVLFGVYFFFLKSVS